MRAQLKIKTSLVKVFAFFCSCYTSLLRQVNQNCCLCECNILNITLKHILNLERHLHILFMQHLYHFRICFPFALLVFLTSGERFRRMKFTAGVDNCVDKMMGNFPTDLILYRVLWDDGALSHQSLML